MSDIDYYINEIERWQDLAISRKSQINDLEQRVNSLHKLHNQITDST